MNRIIYRQIVLINFAAARAYGCFSTSFSRLERDTRRRGAFSLYWDSNAFALSEKCNSLEYSLQV